MTSPAMMPFTVEPRTMAMICDWVSGAEMQRRQPVEHPEHATEHHPEDRLLHVIPP